MNLAGELHQDRSSPVKLLASIRANFWIAAILLAGAVYLLALQGLIPDGAYFSGDAGLKALLSQDIAAGQTDFSLRLVEPPWIKPLWDRGLFPYEEPYVYRLGEQAYITFPYTFPLVTAPFYAGLGYRGLYLVPVLATFLTWLSFVWVCKKLGFGPALTALGTAFLIFCTNLTLFSAMYWEHTLAVCLSFGGFGLLVPARGSRTAGLWAMAGAGILTGLAAWFRPEQVLLVILIDLLAGWPLFTRVWKNLPGKIERLVAIPAVFDRNFWIYPLASTLTLLMYGLSNQAIYGSFFGVHAIQVMVNPGLRVRIKTMLENLGLMTIGELSIFMSIPILGFLLATLVCAWFRPALLKKAREWSLWVLFGLAFIVGAAMLVPAGAGGKEWGPRFLLFLAPVGTLLFTRQLDQLWIVPAHPGPWLQWAGVALAVVLGGVGILQNPLRGSDFLAESYRQIEPAVQQLRAEF